MSIKDERFGFNANSILITIAILLISWSLKTQYEMNTVLVATVTTVNQHSAILPQLQQSDKDMEKDIINLRLRVQNAAVLNRPGS